MQDDCKIKRLTDEYTARISDLSALLSKMCHPAYIEIDGRVATKYINTALIYEAVREIIRESENYSREIRPDL